MSDAKRHLTAYVQLVRDFGGGFHPDTPVSQYTSVPQGWTRGSVALAVSRMETLQAYHPEIDMYAIALQALECSDG